MVIRGTHLLLVAGILILLGGAAFGAWYYLRPTEENRIRAHFREFSRLASKKSDEGLVSAAGTARAVSKLFTDSTTIEVVGLSWDGPLTREKIAANVLRARALFKTVDLSFDDFEIEVVGNTARVFYSAVLSGDFRDGKPIREVRDLETGLKKDGSGWLFDSFKVREIIKK